MPATQWRPAKLGIIVRKCEIAYANGCLLYAYTHVFVDPSTGKRHEFHCCGLTGHDTLGGGTMDAMKEAAVRLALEHGPIGDERRFSRGEFEAMVDSAHPSIPQRPVQAAPDRTI